MPNLSKIKLYCEFLTIVPKQIWRKISKMIKHKPVSVMYRCKQWLVVLSTKVCIGMVMLLCHITVHTCEMEHFQKVYESVNDYCCTVSEISGLKTFHSVGVNRRQTVVLLLWQFLKRRSVLATVSTQTADVPRQLFLLLTPTYFPIQK